MCFGYHPYLQINNVKITDLDFETNLKMNVKLDENTLLPIVPLIKNDSIISSSNQYDSLFFNS